MKDINTFLEYLTNIEHVFDEAAYVKGEEFFRYDRNIHF